MARYSKEHKAQSRAAILASAAKLFRQHGYNGVGIDELCADAGLTRGTFYAHFKSKADLLSSVLAGPHDFVTRLNARTAKVPSTLNKAGVKVVQDYLHVDHRAGVIGGCSLASLAMDAIRGSTEAQSAYADAVENVVSELQRGGVSRQQAQTALALCVGGLLVGSACGDNAVGDELATATRKHVTEVLST